MRKEVGVNQMNILVLSTWFPYPPDQGCKIRAYYLIRSLAQRHNVSVISFQDALVQPSWLDHLNQFCHRVEVVPHHPFHYDRVKTLLGWISNKPSAVIASHSDEMADRVVQLAKEWEPDCALALTFVTAPYALAIRGARKIIDIDNLMSPMLYEAIPQDGPVIKRMRRSLAWKKFYNYEKQLYPRFDHCLAVSQKDKKAIIETLSISEERVSVVANGVDLEWNRPGLTEPESNSLIFNGALTYQPNFEAMAYFLEEIYPLVKSQIPELKLRITGSTTGVAVDKLPYHDEVVFTGYLKDIRPAVASSWASIAPLKAGGGTRLKILEAMALGTPVISTSKGAEGLDAEVGKHLLIADHPNEFARQVICLMRDSELRNDLSWNAAQFVKEKYSWSDIGLGFCRLIETLEKDAIDGK
jgi:polysaccharide biosynthesis protein PslH